MNLPLPPTITAPLFPRIYTAHAAVLARLEPDQWLLPTACAGWTVKDVALHLFGGDVGWLSGGRDGFRESAGVATWDDLIDFINARNDLWVRATRRMSTRVLAALVPILGAEIVTFVNALDPNAPGPAVNWAGSDPAPMWMQIGRELTERWMHHQHICDAVGVTSLKEPDVVHAVLDMFVRALPHTYREMALPDGCALTLWVIGDGGGSWSLVRWSNRWQLFTSTDATALCTVSLPVDTAWRLFTKGVSADEARKQAIIEGDKSLAEPLFHTVSILA